MNPSTARGAAQATTGMLLVGSLVAVSATLSGYPVYGGQALRYAVATAALAALVLIRRRTETAPPPRPTPRQLAQLVLLSGTGLVVFNVCIVEATRHASPALVGIIVGSGPIVLAILGPLVSRSGRRPSPRILTAAVVVTAGTAIATGFGDGTATGVLLALCALGGEVSFSLFAVSLLPVFGALRVSAYTTALAVPMLAAVGLATAGTDTLRMPGTSEAVGIVYLGLVVTVLGFLCWYDALPRLGADRAGLFSGVMPVGAVLTMMLLGLGTPSAAELTGAACVVGGILYGLRAASRAGGPGGREAPRELEVARR